MPRLGTVRVSCPPSFPPSANLAGTCSRGVLVLFHPQGLRAPCDGVRGRSQSYDARSDFLRAMQCYIVDALDLGFSQLRPSLDQLANVRPLKGPAATPNPSTVVTNTSNTASTKLTPSTPSPPPVTQVRKTFARLGRANRSNEGRDVVEKPQTAGSNIQQPIAASPRKTGDVVGALGASQPGSEPSQAPTTGPSAAGASPVVDPVSQVSIGRMPRGASSLL